MSVHTAKRHRRPTTFGEGLRALREAKGLGLVELAKAVPIDPALLSKIERGLRQPPNLSMITRIMAPLGLDQESQEFRALYRLTGRGEIMTNDQLMAFLKNVPVEEPELQKPWVSELADAPKVVKCSTLAELVGRATECVVESRAVAVAVLGEDRTVRRFQLSEEHIHADER